MATNTGATGVEDSESGMELRDLLNDRDFPQRARPGTHSSHGFEALDQLAHVFSEAPDVVLQRLVDIAVEFCGADSAGISLEEAGENGELRFRWIVVSGSFAKYLYGTTPRFFSPCGTCLSSGRAQLYRLTKPYYDFLGIEADPITDGILIPWTTEGLRGTLWAVSHCSREAFTMDDYRLLNSLADFASIAIRHQSREKALRERARMKASAARANELAHRINNPLQSLTNTLYLAVQGGEEAQSFIEQATMELDALSSLVDELLRLGNANQWLSEYAVEEKSVKSGAQAASQ